MKRKLNESETTLKCYSTIEWEGEARAAIPIRQHRSDNGMAGPHALGLRKTGIGAAGQGLRTAETQPSFEAWQQDKKPCYPREYLTESGKEKKLTDQSVNDGAGILLPARPSVKFNFSLIFQYVEYRPARGTPTGQSRFVMEKIMGNLRACRPAVALASCVTAVLLALPINSARADDLAGIFDLAVNNDPEIRQARANFNAAHTTVDQGRSFLLPRVTLNGSTSRDTAGPAVDTAFGSAHSFENGFNTKGYSLNISQALLNFEAWYAFQSAKQTDLQAAANLAQAEQQLILKVATAYFNVLRSQDNLASFRAEEDAASRVLEQTRERFEVGLIPITDVYDSQANADLARVNRLVEENNLNQALEALEAITGRAHSDLESLSTEFPIESLAPETLEDWVNLAMGNNLAIKAAEHDFEARKEDARSARAAMFPTLEINAGYGWNQSANQFSFFPGIASERTNITLNFTYPLFAGGLNAARKRQAYYTRDASEEALLKTERDSTQSTRNSYRSVETDVLAVQARAQAIVSAESALEATEVGAEVGTRNVVDVVLAQRTLFQARRDYANARYNYVINTLNLKQAAGILNPQDIIDLNNWLE